MDEKTAKTLVKGDQVYWEDDENDIGTIQETDIYLGSGAVLITWKKNDFTGWIDCEDAKSISKI